MRFPDRVSFIYSISALLEVITGCLGEFDEPAPVRQEKIKETLQGLYSRREEEGTHTHFLEIAL